MEKLKFSKSFRKLEKRSTDKFVNDLYFKPKRREKLRESFVEGRDNFLKMLEKPVWRDSGIDKVKNRYWADVFSYQMSQLIDVIDNVVPRKLKEIELTNGRFKLFKKHNRNFLAIECKYDKGIPKKHHRTFLLIPSGLPGKGARTKIQFIRDAYDLKGFEQRDEGTFTQKLMSFVKAHQTFKGKKRTVKFELTQRGKVKDNNWLRLI